jgi:hypothetical protein
MNYELNFHKSTIFGQLTKKPIIYYSGLIASLLRSHFFFTIVAILLIENASFSRWFQLWISWWPRCSLQLVDPLSVEGIWDSLPIAFSESLVTLVLVFHLNYNFKARRVINLWIQRPFIFNFLN